MYFFFEPTPYKIAPKEYMTPPNIMNKTGVRPIWLIKGLAKNKTLQPFIKWHKTSIHCTLSIFTQEAKIPTKVTKDTKPKKK